MTMTSSMSLRMSALVAGARWARGYTATKSVLHFCNYDARCLRSCKYATSGLGSW